MLSITYLVYSVNYNYLVCFLSITASQDAHNRLVLQVAEWLTALLSGFKGRTRRELTTQPLNKTAATYLLLSARNPGAHKQ